MIGISRNSLNNAKIGVVNVKFATSILSETINKLTIIHCDDVANTDILGKNIPNPTRVNTKFGEDVNHIKCSFKQVILQLRFDQRFLDISERSLAESASNFLYDYECNKAILEEKSSMLQELKELISNHRGSTATVDEIIIKCAMKLRLNKNWECTRRNEQENFYRILLGDLQGEIDRYSTKTEFENRCILEIENFSLTEMDIHKLETVRWLEKFDEDLNKTEIDIQKAAAELEQMKINFETVVEDIKTRDQEMKDFVALKIEREAQKNSDLTKLIYGYKDHLFNKILLT